jgi:hypothetical protein
MAPRNKVIDPTPWNEAVRRLKDAAEAHDNATTAEEIARGKLTQATNELNAAQKELDKLINAVRADAPWGSDWHTERDRVSRVIA